MVVKASSPRRERPRVAPALQAYVDGIPLPAALLDDHGRIRVLNHAWEDEARPGGLVAPTDRIGSDHVHDLRDEKGFSREAGRGLAQVLESVVLGQRRAARFPYAIESDGHMRHWEATLTGLDVAGQRFILLVHRDRTSEEHAGRMGTRVGELLLEREQQTAVARDRQRLLGAGEQSFHAPLTPIRLQLHMLKDGTLGRLTQRQEAALERIERNVNRWWHLQEAFLSDLQALEADQHPPEAADLNDLLEEALQPFRERALKAGVRLRVDRSDAPLRVHIDRRAVLQVMLLLIDHAIRQTPAGGMVWVRLRGADGHGELVVQDQDPEVDPHQARDLLAAHGHETSLRSGLLHARVVLGRNGGQLAASCPGAGRGLEVCLSLPLA